MNPLPVGTLEASPTDRAKAVCQRASERALHNCRTAEEETVPGIAPDAIWKRDRDAEALVLGRRDVGMSARGMGCVRELPPRSDTAAVARDASTSVLVVR